MRTGESALHTRLGGPRPARKQASRAAPGFTYLWLLFVVAIGSAGLAALGQHWQTAVQRDRETEMAFRAQQIADAIARYHALSPEGAPAWPKSLAALLDDRRGGTRRQHLRRVYTDPFTGTADWALVTDEQGGIQGLHSAADVPALITRNTPVGAAQGRVLRVSDRVFLASASRNAVALPVPTPAFPASAASAAEDE